MSCIPQPPPGEKVDGLADRVMFRLAYRNFGDRRIFEFIASSFVVNPETTPSKISSRYALAVTTRYMKEENRTASGTYK